MPKGICPVCDGDVRLSQEDAVLYNQVHCSKCGALLEVVEESPLELEEVFEGGAEGAR
jgi:lysine biosynthesis protein LysW